MEALNPRPGPLDILETCLYADDLEGARGFYGDVLGLTLVSEVAGRHLFFRLGAGMLLIFRPEASRIGGELPGHGATGPGHLCFKVEEADVGAWRDYLEARGVQIIAEQAWPKGGRSLYFEDPAGNVLELAPARIWG